MKKSIKNVSNFIKFIEKNSNYNEKWFFRGESMDYGANKLTPSLYRKPYIRNYRSELRKCDPLNEYKLIAKELYSELGGVKKRDKKNFMAFCQHHSIPTPLLDVSTSPLVALYFASISHNDNDGKLYTFDSSRYIYRENSFLEYDDDLDNFPFIRANYKEIVDEIDRFIASNESCNDYFYNIMIDSLFKDINDFINSFDKGIQDSLRDNTNIILENKNLDSIRSLIIKPQKNNIYSNNPVTPSVDYVRYLNSMGIIKKNKKFYDENDNYVDVITDSYIYYFILWAFRITKNSKKGFFHPSNLQFYTSTSLKWDRIKAQNGHFLVIIANNIRVEKTSDGKYAKKYKCTTLEPDYVLTIPSKFKRKILKELDTMNINEKTLFLDVDNIANYISNNHF